MCCKDALIATAAITIGNTDTVVKAPRPCFGMTMRANGRLVAAITGGVCNKIHERIVNRLEDCAKRCNYLIRHFTDDTVEPTNERCKQSSLPVSWDTEASSNAAIKHFSEERKLVKGDLQELSDLQG